jgi:hypothetical protein
MAWGSAVQQAPTGLRKIFARMQQMRNTDFGVEKTEQKRNKETPTENVEVVWKKQILLGFPTDLALSCSRSRRRIRGLWHVPSRQNFFFDPRTMDSRRLNANVVNVKLNGKDLFRPRCPVHPLRYAPLV